MFRYIALLAVLSFATPALARDGVRRNDQFDPKTVGGAAIADAKIFDDVAINSEATSSVMDVLGFNSVTLEVQYTRSAGTAVTFQCDTSRDRVIWFTIQAIKVSTGTGALTDLTWSKTTSASDNYAVNLVSNYAFLRCRFTGTGADGSDKVTVYARLGML